MGRRIDVDDLVGTHEIADRLGVARPQVVHDWRRRHPEFPTPILQVSGVWIWSWKAIDRWAKATGRDVKH